MEFFLVLYMNSQCGKLFGILKILGQTELVPECYGTVISDLPHSPEPWYSIDMA